MARDVASDFRRETAGHQMTVARDDGVYRHLKFRNPTSPFYWFHVVTWPGHLAIVGDAGDFVFARTYDMFEWFRADDGRINPHYWAQKLQAPRGTAGVEEFSADAYQRRVLEFFANEAAQMLDMDESEADAVDEEWLGRHWFSTPYGGDESEWQRDDELSALEQAAALLYDVRDQLLHPHGEWHREHGAHEALSGFEHTGSDGAITLGDWWEWDFHQFNVQFIWCCHAIVYAIAAYDRLDPYDHWRALLWGGPTKAAEVAA